MLMVVQNVMSNETNKMIKERILSGKDIAPGEIEAFQAEVRNGFMKDNRKFLKIFKDGKVSVEEAFYFARYTLRTDEAYKEYRRMQPQINDKYPHSGYILSLKDLILGQ